MVGRRGLLDLLARLMEALRAQSPETALAEKARALLGELATLRAQALAAETAFNWGLGDEAFAKFPDKLASARNLVHSVVLRSGTEREELAELLKQLCLDVGCHETHNLAAVDTAITICATLSGEQVPALEPRPLSRSEGRRLLLERKTAIYGKGRGNGSRYPAIMVTLDPATASLDVVTALLGKGMDVARINTAHDSPQDWDGLLKRLRDAEAALGLTEDRCRLHVDLAGPKLRSLPVVEAAVRKYRPVRDEHGAVVRTVQITLANRDADSRGGKVPLQEDKLLRRAKLGDTVRIKDSRGKKRKGMVVAAKGDEVTVEMSDTCYLEEGASMKLLGGKGKCKTKVCPLRSVRPVPLEVGCKLWLVPPDDPGSVAKRRVPVELGGALLKVGERVLLDDGVVLARVVRLASCEEAECVVEMCPPGFKLKAEKGINLPDTVFPLAISALTHQDLANLGHVLRACEHDRPLTIGLSFVRSEDDVRQLFRALQNAGAAERRVSVCIKIETHAALLALPLVLLACLAGPCPASVMIARGDLAAEIGFSRLNPAMDDIVTLAAAAHLPVVFATQVLETLAKTGTPSRSEMSDVAAASRCECVMLNKGPHLVAAVAFLSGLLQKQLHRNHKHHLMLRQLSSIDLCRFLPSHAPAEGRAVTPTI